MNKFRQFWRIKLGWLPIQFCMICGKPFWAGLPSFGIDWKAFADGSEGYTVVVNWLPWWQDYCSQKCADADSEPV